MELFNTRTIILNEDDAESKRQEIRDYFHHTYALDEQLYDFLAGDEAFYLRAEPLRHPLIFYFGHTAAFFINKLTIARLIDQRINPRFESMFAIGVDEMSWDDLDEAHYNWPGVKEVRTFRHQVRELIDSVINSLPLHMPITWNSPFWAIMMSIEHQRIHLETSSVIIRRLPLDQVRELDGWDICPAHGSAPENRLLPVHGGKVRLGKPKDHPLYGWDNEFGQRESEVWDFAASQYLVSNEEFRVFVDDRGYDRTDLWTEEGRQWQRFSGATHPLFWIITEHGFKLRTMASVIDMAWDWPVEVNYLEAKAFCNWLADTQGRSIRLPTEDQWYRLREIHQIPDQPYWESAPGNINLEHWASSCPVNHFRFGDFYDIIGNVWQWTETPIEGFEGFEVHPFYDDFSTPTFDTRHNLMKGGSWISTGNEATRDSRYAFRRHFFQHAGFRYVESDQPLEEPQAMYETDSIVSQYCEAHYGDIYFDIEHFPAVCARICAQYMKDRPKNKALDLGCSVGRSTFELARTFDFVHGLDFSARFIRIAFQLQEKGYVRYEVPEEGEIVSYREKHLADFGLETCTDRVEFHQADAANLKERFTGYDLIFSGNMLDRMVNPAGFLSTVHERLNVGGLLVVTSPYTWVETFTAKEHWLGGIRKDGEPYYTIDGLRDLLASHFTLVDEPRDIPFVIRETRRKFQHTIAQMTVWQRHG